MFKRPKEVVFDVSENVLLSTEIGVSWVIQKSLKTPTPNESYLYFKVLIKIRTAQIRDTALNSILSKMATSKIVLVFQIRHIAILDRILSILVHSILFNIVFVIFFFFFVQL